MGLSGQTLCSANESDIFEAVVLNNVGRLILPDVLKFVIECLDRRRLSAVPAMWLSLIAGYAER